MNYSVREASKKATHCMIPTMREWAGNLPTWAAKHQWLPGIREAEGMNRQNRGLMGQ